MDKLLKVSQYSAGGGLPAASDAQAAAASSDIVSLVPANVPVVSAYQSVVSVANEAARLALTSSQVRNGTVVIVESNPPATYEVLDTSSLGSNAAFAQTTRSTERFVVIGDSLSSDNAQPGPTGSWPYLLKTNNPEWAIQEYYNFAVSGANIAAVATQWTGSAAQYAPVTVKDITSVFCWAGTNGTVGTDGVVEYNQLKSLWALIKASGCRLIVVTLFNGPQGAYHAALNALIVSDPTLYDVCIDAESILPDVNNLTYFYNDGTHPNPAGNLLLETAFANQVRPGANAFIAKAGGGTVVGDVYATNFWVSNSFLVQSGGTFAHYLLANIRYNTGSSPEATWDFVNWLVSAFVGARAKFFVAETSAMGFYLGTDGRLRWNSGSSSVDVTNTAADAFLALRALSLSATSSADGLYFGTDGRVRWNSGSSSIDVTNTAADTFLALRALTMRASSSAGGFYLGTDGRILWNNAQSTVDVVNEAASAFLDLRAKVLIGTSGATIGTLTGVLKAASGVVSAAVGGTDYLAPAGSGAALTGITGGQVANTPAGNIAATTAQGAINELDTEKAPLVGSSDIEITDTTKGYILKSPDGTRYRITVANGGALVTTAI